MLDLETSEEELCAFLSRRGQIFKRVMPLVMRNIAIAQQRDIERYKRVRGGGWDRPKAKFEPGDFDMLKQAKHTALEHIARPHVLRIVEIRPSGAVVMEGSDAARREEQIKNIANCPLPVLDTNMYPERYFRGPSLHFFVCGTRHRATKMVICDKCSAGCHIWCLDVPLMRVPDEPWTCARH